MVWVSVFSEVVSKMLLLGSSGMNTVVAVHFIAIKGIHTGH
jgi:hypothetical protein